MKDQTNVIEVSDVSDRPAARGSSLKHLTTVIVLIVAMIGSGATR